MVLPSKRKIAAALIGWSAALLMSVFAYGQDAALSSDEQARYLEGLKRLYLVGDERTALLTHANALLAAYMLKSGYQLDQTDPRDLRYEVRLGAPGELVIREEQRAEQGPGLSVRNRRFALFGVDPFIRYECPPTGIACTFAEPGGHAPMLSILRDQDGADQLAKALSLLIRNVQRG
jgi:hypothetical protein